MQDQTTNILGFLAVGLITRCLVQWEASRTNSDWTEQVSRGIAFAGYFFLAIKFLNQPYMTIATVMGSGVVFELVARRKFHELFYLLLHVAIITFAQFQQISQIGIIGLIGFLVLRVKLIKNLFALKVSEQSPSSS